MDKELLDLLKAAAAKFPGLRFCQLLYNIMPDEHLREDGVARDFYYVTDKQLKDFLKKYMKEN